MQLSSLDLKIIRYITEHGLLESEREIAKKLRINPSTLSYKLRKFEDNKTIVNYKYRIDYARIGLGKIAWVFAKSRTKNIQHTSEKILQNPIVHNCLFTTGEKNFCIKIITFGKKEIKEFEKSLKESGFVGIEIFEIKEEIKSHNKILKKTKKGKVDLEDLKIISEKMIDPKKSINKIADALGMHRNTVSNRWNKLIEQKIITKKTPIINPEIYGTGIHLMALNLIEANDNEAKKVIEFGKKSEVHELDYIEKGKFIAIIRTKNLEEYFTIQNQIFSLPVKENAAKIIIRANSRKHTYLRDLGIEKIAKILKTK